MKRIVNIFLSFLFLAAFGANSYSQDTKKEVRTDTIQVAGVCEMCEERIENAALLKGVKKVEWTPESHALIVVYRTDKVTIEEIAQSVADAGHDNEIMNTSEEAYDKIHSCCKYREDSHPH